VLAGRDWRLKAAGKHDAIGREGDVIERSVANREPATLLAGGRIPQADVLVVGGRDDEGGVGRQGDAMGILLVGVFDLEQLFAGGAVPKANRAVAGRRGQAVASAIERQGEDRSFVPDEAL